MAGKAQSILWKAKPLMLLGSLESKNRGGWDPQGHERARKDPPDPAAFLADSDRCSFEMRMWDKKLAPWLGRVKDGIRFLMMSMMCNGVLQPSFVSKHSQMRIDWRCEAGTG
jgi:hypothetical protein